jgi:hypothetical protein
MHTRNICRNLCLSFTLRYVLARPSITQNNRYHGCVLDVKLLLYGVNRPPRLLIRLGMSRTIPLIPFCACIACCRDTFTVNHCLLLLRGSWQHWWGGVCTAHGCMVQRFGTVVWDVSYLHPSARISMDITWLHTSVSISRKMYRNYILQQALAWTFLNYDLQHVWARTCLISTPQHISKSKSLTISFNTQWQKDVFEFHPSVCISTNLPVEDMLQHVLEIWCETAQTNIYTNRNIPLKTFKPLLQCT